MQKYIITAIRNDGYQVSFSGQKETQLKAARKTIKAEGGDWKIKVEKYLNSLLVDTKFLPR